MEDEDDDETCGFCRFMKAGGCKDEFNVRRSCLRVCRVLFWTCYPCFGCLPGLHLHSVPISLVVILPGSRLGR